MTTAVRRRETVEAGKEGSPAALLRLIGGLGVTSALYVAAQLGIADALTEGPREVGELARACGADERSLQRLMRLLVAVDVFEEIDGVFGLGPLGHHLREGVPGSLRAAALAIGSPWMMLPWTELLRSVRTGAPAFDRLFGKQLFEYLSEHPEESGIFDAFMGDITRSSAERVVGAYDFSGLTRVVDVGGGQGNLISTILLAAPHVEGILFDQPRVLGRGKEELGKAGLTDRCEVVGGDFFTSVPAGGDGYILSRVLHDWDDERCGRILRNIRAEIPRHGRLLILESLVTDERIPLLVAMVDLRMLVMTGGGYERSEAEYRALLNRAGFELERIIPTWASQYLFEARPVDAPTEHGQNEQTRKEASSGPR